MKCIILFIATAYSSFILNESCFAGRSLTLETRLGLLPPHSCFMVK